MELWYTAMDKLTALEENNDLSVDQQLKALEILALLSVSQELSGINPQNTTTRDKDGTTRNGWGFPIDR